MSCSLTSTFILLLAFVLLVLTGTNGYVNSHLFYMDFNYFTCEKSNNVEIIVIHLQKNSFGIQITLNQLLLFIISSFLECSGNFPMAAPILCTSQKIFNEPLSVIVYCYNFRISEEILIKFDTYLFFLRTIICRKRAYLSSCWLYHPSVIDNKKIFFKYLLKKLVKKIPI